MWFYIATPITCNLKNGDENAPILNVVTLVYIECVVRPESVRMPPGSLVRQSLCKITNENLDFSDVVDLARNLPRDENSPAGIRFRRPMFRLPSLWKIGTLWLLCTNQLVRHGGAQDCRRE